MNKKKEAKFKSSMSIRQAIAYLNDIVKSLQAGTISVANGPHALTLKPEDAVRVELEAAQKQDRESISFSISWRKEEPQNGHLDLRISAEEPAAATDE